MAGDSTDTQLATRYLTGQWRKHTKIENDTPPLGLTEAVVQTVCAVGYKRATVDKMLEGYLKAQRASNEQ